MREEECLGTVLKVVQVAGEVVTGQGVVRRTRCLGATQAGQVSVGGRPGAPPAHVAYQVVPHGRLQGEERVLHLQEVPG